MEVLPSSLPDTPLPLLAKWMQDAVASNTLPNPDAMTLATTDASGCPAARIVLCKELVTDPGYLVFYTNYNSAKGEALDKNNRVAAVFHWDQLNRQARIEGIALKSPAEESDTYFATRDKESQIGAWASAQSQPIDARQSLKTKHVATTRKLSNLAMDSGIMDIPRPAFWGGYRLVPNAIEFWQNQDDRLHDRELYERDGSVWRCTRLAP